MLEADQSLDRVGVAIHISDSEPGTITHWAMCYPFNFIRAKVWGRLQAGFNESFDDWFKPPSWSRSLVSTPRAQTYA